MSERDAGRRTESAAQVHLRLEDLVGYRDGDLPSAALLEVEQHAKGCLACSARLAAAQQVLAEVDFIAEQPLADESPEVELLWERLRLVHEARWQKDHPAATHFGLGIRSRPGPGTIRVGVMAKQKRKGLAADGAPSGADGAFALWSAGDLKLARATARDLLKQSPSEADRAKLERLLADTSPDPRAVQVALFCLAVAAMVVLLTKLFG